jgi:hypothetical protein
VFQCDFWELPAVQQLARDAATAPLLKLLDVMLNGDLAGEPEELCCILCPRLSITFAWMLYSTAGAVSVSAMLFAAPAVHVVLLAPAVT